MTVAMINVGLIGTGRHGSRYARHLLEDCNHARLAAIARRSPEGAVQAGRWGAVWHPDWQDLVASPEVEAVIAVVPPSLNLEIARACSSRRKPLLVEKPLAISPATGRLLLESMRSAGVSLTVAQTLRFNPVIQALRREYRNRGQLLSVYAQQRLEPTLHDWLDRPELAGAGVTYHTAVHVFDALHFITGRKIRRVRADCRACRQSRLEDLALIGFELDDGIPGQIDISKLSRARSGRYELVFAESQLQADQVHGYLDSIVEGRLERLESFGPVPTIVPLLQDWLGYLRGRNANPVEPEDGLQAISVSEACLQSSKNDGSWFTVDDAGRDSIRQRYQNDDPAAAGQQ